MGSYNKTLENNFSEAIPGLSNSLPSFRLALLGCCNDHNISDKLQR